MLFRRELLLLFTVSQASAFQQRPAADLYFVPVGDAPLAEIATLVKHFRNRFGLRIGVLPPVPIGPEHRNPARQQVTAEPLLMSMVKACRARLARNSAVLIGITNEDLYPLT